MGWPRLFPTYGNWGGPGWSGGEYPSSPSDTDWEVPSVDSMDEVFKEHDRRYQLAISDYDNGLITEEEKENFWVEADKFLVKSLDDMPMDPNKWENKPTTCKTWYAWGYRKLAILSFNILIWLRK